MDRCSPEDSVLHLRQNVPLIMGQQLHKHTASMTSHLVTAAFSLALGRSFTFEDYAVDCDPTLALPHKVRDWKLGYFVLKAQQELFCEGLWCGLCYQRDRIWISTGKHEKDFVVCCSTFQQIFFFNFKGMSFSIVFLMWEIKFIIVVFSLIILFVLIHRWYYLSLYWLCCPTQPKTLLCVTTHSWSCWTYYIRWQWEHVGIRFDIVCG